MLCAFFEALAAEENLFCDATVMLEHTTLEEHRGLLLMESNAVAFNFSHAQVLFCVHFACCTCVVFVLIQCCRPTLSWFCVSTTVCPPTERRCTSHIRSRSLCSPWNM